MPISRARRSNSASAILASIATVTPPNLAPATFDGFRHSEHDRITINNAVTFLGNAAFAGQTNAIRFVAHVAAQTTSVFFDSDGNKVADIEIPLTGVHHRVAGDFGL